MKQFLSIILIICLVSGTVLPKVAFAMEGTITVENPSDQEEKDNIPVDSEGITEEKDTDNTETDGNTDNANSDSDSDPKDGDKVITDPDSEATDKDDTGIEDGSTDEDTTDGKNDSTEKKEEEKGGEETAPQPEILNNEENESIFLNVNVDNGRNISIFSSPEIFYLVADDEDNQGNIVVMFFVDNTDVEITEDGINVTVPELWSYEIDMDANIVTIIPFNGKIHVSVDDYRFVTVKTLSSIHYDVVDDNGEGSIEVMFFLDDPYTDMDEYNILEITEDDILINLPETWSYEINIDSLVVTLVPPQLITERAPITITVDDERNVTVVVPVGIEYEIIGEESEGSISIMFFSDDPDMEIHEDDIIVNVPEMWNYEINMDHLTVIIMPPQPIAERVLITITVDDEREVTVTAPAGVEYEVTDSDDKSNIYVSLDVVNPEIEISEDNIVVDVPLNWSFVVDVDSLVITVILFVEKTEFTFEELVEMGAIEVVASNPRTRSVYEQTFIIHDHARADTWGTLSQAVDRATQYATSPTLIQLTSSFNSGAAIAITITNGRYIHLESSVPGVTRTLTQNVGNTTNNSSPSSAEDARHFKVTVGARLQIKDIILDGGNASFFRGGVYVEGWSQWEWSRFTMLDGSIIENCHANHGGAVSVNNGAIADLFGGIIRHNRATPFLVWGGIRATGLGGGVHVNTNAFLTTKDIVLYKNEANWGGAIDVHDRGNLTIEDGTLIDNNIAHTDGGGGVLVWNNSTLVINGGKIINNTAQEGGGIKVTISTNSRTDTSSFTLNNGIIAHNTANIQGGGIAGLDMRASYLPPNPPSSYAQTIRINGGKIYDNKAPVGGGIFVSTGTLETNGGEIHSNESLTGAGTGAGIYWMGGDWTGTGTNIYGNKASQYGGGVAALGAGIRTLSSNVNIYDNDAVVGGGGIHIATGTGFTMNSGTIRNNTANDGGGLFVAFGNRGNVIIGQGVSFTKNEAHNGVKVDDIGAQNNPQINPGTVSLTWHGGNNHAFTNYDINTTTGFPLFQVTYEVGTGTGEITAIINGTNTIINDGDYVPGNTQVTFSAHPQQQFEQWDISTKTDTNAPFVFKNSDDVTPMTISITAHTQVIANFNVVVFTTLTVTKKITGVTANMNKTFDFTVTFTGPDGVTPLPADTQFSYIGDVIPGLGATAPQNGTLILDSTGSAMFALGHGQAIVIRDVPLSGHVQIIEEPAEYTASFTDSEDESADGNSNDTKLLAMAEDRIISFINELEYTPPTGVDAGDIERLMLLAAVISVAVIPVFTPAIIRRRRRT
ncbi:MAG: hypothetical protein FWC32_12120 [Firmicutes bacterium]|nr:hypothetical protein [Bacillota bacterium]